MRLLLVERDSFHRKSLRQALQALGGHAVVEAASPTQALAQLRRSGVDMLLLGLDGGSAQRMEEARRLRQQDHRLPLVVLGVTMDDDSLMAAITLGASAWLPRNTSPEFLVSTLARIAEGEHPIQYDLLSHAGVAGQLLAWFRERPLALQVQATPSPMGDRERLILEHVARGYSNKEIGQRLGASEQTVKNRLSVILRKSGARDRAQAAVLALMQGWVSLPPQDLPSLPEPDQGVPPGGDRRGSQSPTVSEPGPRRAQGAAPLEGRGSGPGRRPRPAERGPGRG